MEIYGRSGTLAAAGTDSPQLSQVVLHRAKGDNMLAPLPVPERFTFAARGTPSGEAVNVGQMYTLFVRAIRDGNSRQPTFATAVDLHRLVDSIEQASDNGREVNFEWQFAAANCRRMAGAWPAMRTRGARCRDRP